MEAVDVYTKQCSIGVTAKQLGIMGATLANGGVNPVTGKRVLDAKYVPKVLAIMMTAGFYNESGDWPTPLACRPRPASAAASSRSCPARWRSSPFHRA